MARPTFLRRVVDIVVAELHTCLVLLQALDAQHTALRRRLQALDRRLLGLARERRRDQGDANDNWGGMAVNQRNVWLTLRLIAQLFISFLTYCNITITLKDMRL